MRRITALFSQLAQLLRRLWTRVSAIIDPRPCGTCGGRVELPASVCLRCSSKIIRPQPGPQTEFLLAWAFMVLFGGAAGGGKSFGLLADAYARGQGNPDWTGCIFRHRDVDVTKRGGIWDKAVEFFEPLGCRIREHRKDITFPGGGVLMFRHLDKKTYQNWRGIELQWAGFDEANEMDLEWIVFVVGRLRSSSGISCVARLTCNPDPDHGLAAWVAHGLSPDGSADLSKSGQVRYFGRSETTGKFVFADSRAEAARLSGRDPKLIKTFAFIPALLEHNVILNAADPEYRGNLALQGIVVEKQLLGGNWFARAETGGMLRRSRWGSVDAPLAPIVRSIRAWDTGGSRPTQAYPNPDFTAGVLMQWDIHGRFYVSGLAACREEGPERDRLMEAVASSDGPTVIQVVKQAGGDDGKLGAWHRRKIAASGGGEVITTKEGKAKAVRAEPLAKALEVGMGGKPGTPAWEYRGYILNTGSWLSQPYSDAGNAPNTLGRLLWSQVAPFWDPDADHDDVPDAMADAYNEGIKGSGRQRVKPKQRARQRA